MSSSKTTLTVFPVVVGIDFEETGDNALREAVRFAAGRQGVEIHAVHALHETADGSNRTGAIERKNELLEKTPERMRAYLADRRVHFPEMAGQNIVMHTRLGPPASALLQVAVDTDAELIVVGTHGRTGLKKLVLGSVAQQLVQTAACPVLIARPKDFHGLEPTAKPEPLCPDCARAREESNGARLWCDFHARPHVKLHVWGSSAVFSVGGHDPGLIAGG